MKNKTIAILLLATTISISGCGGCSKNEASTEPTEPVEEKVRSELEKYPYSLEDLNKMYGNLRTLAL